MTNLPTLTSNYYTAEALCGTDYAERMFFPHEYSRPVIGLTNFTAHPESKARGMWTAALIEAIFEGREYANL